MCGIVGYAGPRAAAPSDRPVEVALQGLARLEYRGYDSAGIAVIDDGAVHITKRAGKLKNLREALGEKPVTTGGAVIGHTRWATHGAPTDGNAHPHHGGRDGEVALVHNGIIENFAALRSELEGQGFPFRSETDSEAAAHLVAREMEETGDLTEALRRTIGHLEGAFTLLAVHRDAPGTVVAARRNSPLVIGLGEGENFLGSDVAAFVDSTKEALEIDQDQIVTVTADAVRVIDAEGAEVSDPTRFTIEWDATAAQKGGYPSFMAKEIHEQASAVADTLRGRIEDGALHLDDMRVDESVLRSIDKIVVVACGTAAHAGSVAKYAIEHWCRIPTEVEL
ncbi:MAG TPA: isomerizing glutamine--fructose-6-phosphate transaminase, partial [Candidatus Brachybacterium merdigallinarum]|nr:isomerizing glutamine--fructose-6-phosphate transaminase [Candidatus Brachybacterium merdigallinarum]